MERLKGKKVLVTGGAGFIGSHVVSQLLELECVVSVIDITVDSKSYFKKQKLQDLVSFEIVDVRKQKEISLYISSLRPEYILHLAAEPIVSSAFDNPIDTFQTNIMGTAYILEACRNIKNLQGIIVASSDKAYGKTKEKYTENSPLHGDHPYDVSKSSTDLIAQTYFKTYKLPVAITRFGNVYGEGDVHFDRIIPGICKSIISGETLEIRSDGTYIRDYLYVKDVVDGYLFLTENFEKAKGEAFNFSSNDTHSVLELIKKSEEILGEKIDYKILNTAKNEIPYQHLDDRKIKKLGWEQKFNLHKGLKETYAWYKELFSA